MIPRRLYTFAVLLAAMPTLLHAQDRSAARLRELVQGLTVTPRVLVIGAAPQDADADLIAWLARGHGIQTGYLSLTRGESGQNFVGAETNVSLGAIRTEEALAARRVDGGEQFFTRAIDFGFSKTAKETMDLWGREKVLGDVVWALTGELDPGLAEERAG